MRRIALAMAVAVVVSCGGGTLPLPSAAIPTPTVSAGARPTASGSESPRILGKGRVDKGSFRSAALNRTMQYLVYLPPGYDANPTTRYPTAYLLHGGSGFMTEWVDYGVFEVADRLMGTGTIPQFIIALPQGDQEYWVDHVIDRTTGANGEKWGTYTARDVVPIIDARYRTVARPDERAIGGLSMGGHGAMQLALNFPGIWSAVGAHSPSLRPEGDAPTYLGFGKAFAARDPLALIKANPDIARAYTWWIDTGDVDPWRGPAAGIHSQLASFGIPHTWKQHSGDHSAQYWSAHVEDYLRYYAGALCRTASSCP